VHICKKDFSCSAAISHSDAIPWYQRTFPSSIRHLQHLIRTPCDSRSPAFLFVRPARRD
jgi:hypothetical protein